jgi:chemotaxis protein methyltransferase CheR
MTFESNNYNVEIGIVETRKIIGVIQEKYNYDYKDYALTFFKRRLERIINSLGFKNADQLIDKLINEKGYFDQFIQEISVEDTEMFRDPSLWRVIRDDFLLEQTKDNTAYRIWMVNAISGEELFSMLILLAEMNLTDKIEIDVTYESIKNYEVIKNGIFNIKKIELNDSNYKRYNCYSDLTKYYKVINNTGYWDTSLIKKVNFLKQNVTFDSLRRPYNLIWFRNQMIYYNQILQDRVLGLLYDNLVQGGHLVIGDKETVEHSTYNKKFKQIIDNEKIFKRL